MIQCTRRPPVGSRSARPQPLHRPIRCLLALLFAGTAACTPAVRPSPAPERPPIQARITSIAIQGGWIKVEVTLPHPLPAPVPVVISPLNSDYDLLRLGIGTVRFRTNWKALRALRRDPETARTTDEAREQKPLIGRWILASDRPGNVGEGYFQTISYEAQKAVPQVMRALRLVEGVDLQKVGIAGSSTSGFLALQAFATERALAAAFVRAATGEYECFLRYSDLAFNNDPQWLREGALPIDAGYAARLPKMDPANRAELFPPRPLRLVTGAEDEAIPARCVKRFAETVERAYAEAGVPGSFQWTELADVTHRLPRSTLLTAQRFWLSRLRPGGARPPISRP